MLKNIRYLRHSLKGSVADISMFLGVEPKRGTIVPFSFCLGSELNPLFASTSTL